MGLHLNPTEPGDWTDGDDPPELDECSDCNGTGMIDADAPGVHDLEKTCPKCGGSGFLDPPEFDDEPSREEFD